MWTLDIKENEGQVFFDLTDKDGMVVRIDVDQPVSVIKNEIKMIESEKRKVATIFLTSGNRDIDIIYHGFDLWELNNESDVYEFKVNI